MSSALPRPRRISAPASRWLARHPAWPVTALLAGYPLWWALGLADYMWIILAVPLALRLLGWHMSGSRPIRLPPGFGLWLLFLAWTAASIVMITLQAPGTGSSSVTNRILAYGDRTAIYLAVTVLLLYIGNVTEPELAQRKLAWLLGLLGIYTVLLGTIGILAPASEFGSPTLYLMPHSLQANAFIQAQMHPALTQLQDVFGQPVYQGRPKAPYPYTNTWGECLTITLPWLLVASRVDTRHRAARIVTWLTIMLAAVALVYSLNRAAWIAAGFALGYLAVRLAARGRFLLISGIAVLVGAVAAVAVVSPLGSIISLRLQNGQSDRIRAQLFSLAIRDGLSSPVLGYGDTRQQQGSVNSIAIGPTPQCPICGHAEVGSTGQFSLVVICTGFAGAFFYFGFFAWLAWRFRRDPSPYGLAGLLVILLSFIYMWTYDAVPAPLGITMLSCALLWRSDRLQGLAAGQMPRPRLLASRTMAGADTAPLATASAR